MYATSNDGLFLWHLCREVLYTFVVRNPFSILGSTVSEAYTFVTRMKILDKFPIKYFTFFQDYIVIVVKKIIAYFYFFDSLLKYCTLICHDFLPKYCFV